MQRKTLAFFIALSMMVSATLGAYATDHCQSGDVETVITKDMVNVYGTARKVPLSITWYEGLNGGAGAVWVNRKIKLKPRFEAHLKVAVNDLAKDQTDTERIIDGFAIVLSTNQNYLGTGFGGIGYSGITKAYISEVDLYYNKEYDTAANTLALKACFNGTCKYDTSGIEKTFSPVYTGKVPYQANIVLTSYVSSTRLCFGTSYCLSQSYELAAASKLGSPFVYLGFTGFQRGVRKELMLNGTYICEYTVDGKTNNGTVQIAYTLRFQYTMKCPHSSDIPFSDVFYEKITPVIIDLSPCTITVQYGYVTDYNRYMDFYCTKTGTGKVRITGKSGTKDTPFYVVSEIPSKVVAWGHDSKAFASNETICSGTSCELRYNGNYFKLTTSNSTSINFIIYATDAYNSPITLKGTSATLISKLTIKVTGSGCGVTAANHAKGDGYYSLTLTKTSIGQCTLTVAKMTNSYWYYVYAGAPSNAKSSCTVNGYTTTPLLNENVSFVYRCTLKDDYYNVIDPNLLSKIYGITLSQSNYKIKPTQDTSYTLIYNGNSMTTSYIDFKYTTKYMGEYTIKITAKSGTLSGTITSVQVAGTPDSNWNSLTQFSYISTGTTFTTSKTTNYALDKEGYLAYVRFLDIDQKLFVSTYKYSTAFAASQVTAKLTYPHDTTISLTTPTCVMATRNSESVVAVKLPGNTDNYIKRTSYPYNLVLTYGGKSTTIVINYPLSISPYTTCLHPLAEAKTAVTYQNTVFTAGTDAQFASLILKTTDGNLYNYAETVTCTLSGSSSNVMTVKADDKIAGIYTIQMTPKTAGKFTATIKVKSTTVGTKEITVYPAQAYSIKLGANSEYTLVSGTSYKRKAQVDTDSAVATSYQAFDKFGNLLNRAMTPGITVSYTIGGVSQGSAVALTSANYRSSDQHWTWSENSSTLGNYVVTMKCALSGQASTFSYTKIAGGVDPSLVQMKQSATVVNFGNSHYVDVYFYDRNKRNVCLDTAACTKARDMFALTVSTSAYKYTYTGLNNDNSCRYTAASCSEEGQMTVTGKYNGATVGTLTYKVLYETIDPLKSEMAARLTVTKIMTPETTLNLNIQTDVPVYKFTFRKSDGSLITKLDPATTIVAHMVGEDLNTTLIGTRSTSYIEWVYPEADWKDVVAGNYTVDVSINGGAPTKYPVQIFSDGSDADAGNGPYDYINTYLSKTKMTIIAGKSDTLTIELRTSSYKRYNKKVDIKTLGAKDSKGLLGTALTIKFQDGTKNGQAIVTVSSTKTGDDVITFTIDGKNIPTTLLLTVKCADLKTLTIDPSCISSGSALKEGTVISIPSVLFTPYDLYGNLYDDFFDDKVMPTSRLQSLISGSHNKGEAFTLTPIADKTKQKFRLEVATQKIGTISLKSTYYTPTYTILVHSGPIDASKSEARLTSSTTLVAGGSSSFQITPRDKYGNLIDTIKSSDSQYLKVNVGYPSGAKDNTTCTLSGSSFLYTLPMLEKGTIYLKPQYNSGAIPCTSCQVKVTAAAVNLNNTKLVLNDEVLSTTEKTTIKNEDFPTFVVKFYDTYNNQIDDLTGIDAKININGEGKDFLLIRKTANNVYEFEINKTDTTIRKDWMFIVTSENYKLYLNTTKTETKNLIYPLSIINEESGDASNNPVDYDLTIIVPEEIIMNAGEMKQLDMEQKANDGKRWNYWYDDPEKAIKLTFDKDYKECSTHIDLGDKPGKYKIDLVCTKSTLFIGPVTISFDMYNETTGAKITTLKKTVKLTVNPNEISYLACLNKKGEDVAVLDEANADQVYQFTIIGYDKYANVVNQPVTAISYTITPPKGKVNPTITKNTKDYTFQVKLDPIYAGVYKITGEDFKKEYQFTSVPGAPYGANSLLISQDKATAGDTVKVHIIPYDKNNNLITPTGTSPYTAYFHYMLNEKDASPDAKITPNGISSVTYEGKSYQAYEYTQQLIHRDSNYFKATLGNSQCKCVVCICVVSPGPIDFKKSKYIRHDSDKSEFVEIVNGVAEDNYNSNAIYRIYPLDQYGNAIDELKDISGITVTLTNKNEPIIYTMRYNPEAKSPYKFIEFVIDDEAHEQQGLSYKTLVNGTYLLEFKNGTDIVPFDIFLKGTVNDKDASNEPEDLQLTSINEAKLEYDAGMEGEIYIQINTAKGYRKNWHEGFEFKVETCQKDPSFNYTVIKSGTLGVFVIKVTSTLSNTLPEPYDCPLKISASSTKYPEMQVIEKLHPLMIVRPLEIYRAEIDKAYIKDASKYIMVDGNADDPYKFIVYTYDIYGNRNKGLQSTIGLTVSPPLDESLFKYDENADGSINYALTERTAGTYKINSAINEATNKTYLPSTYTFTIKHGAVSAKDTEFVTELEKIEAGRTANMEITFTDQWKNVIPSSEVKDLLNITFVDGKGKSLIPDFGTNGDKMTAMVYVPTSGEGHWSAITIKEKTELLTGDDAINIQVDPADPEALNLVYYKDMTKGKEQKYDTPYSIYYKSEKVNWYAKQYDLYGNEANIKDRISIDNLVLTGNEMDDIVFDAKQDGAIWTQSLPSNNDTAKYTLNHLIAHTGYTFEFDIHHKVKSAGFEASNNVGTADELKNALLTSGLYKLTADITIDNTYTNIERTKDIELDLNGHTLTIKEAQNKNAIHVYGFLVIKNGKVKYASNGTTTISASNGGKIFSYDVFYSDSWVCFGLPAGTPNGEHGYIEVIGGGCTVGRTDGSLIYGDGSTENVIKFRGAFDGSKVTKPFLTTTRSNAQLKIIDDGGKWGFDIKPYVIPSHFSLPVTITTDTDDTGFGNGKFVASLTSFKEMNVIIHAGTKYQIPITFKQKSSLIFNDYVTSDHVVVTSKDELKATYEAGNTRNAASLWLESTTAVDATTVNLTITDDNDKKATFTINVKVLPAKEPDPGMTEIITYPKETLVPPENQISFQFRLSDKYGNKFINMCSNFTDKLTIVDNGDANPQMSPSACDNDGTITINNYEIRYPPPEHHIMVKYEDLDGHSHEVFLEDFVTKVENSLDFSKSEVKCIECPQIVAGRPLDMDVALFDTNSKCYEQEWPKAPLGVKITGTSEAGEPVTKYYEFEQDIITGAVCQNAFKLKPNQNMTKAGTYVLTLYGIEGNDNKTIREWSHVVVPGEPHKEHFYLTHDEDYGNPQSVGAGEDFKFHVQARDEYDNIIKETFKAYYFSVEFKNSTYGDYDPDKMHHNKEDSNGLAYYTDTFNEIGVVRLMFTYQKDETANKEYITKIHIDAKPVTDANGAYDEVAVKPGPCDKEHLTVDWSELEKIIEINNPYTFIINCKDQFGNQCNEGGVEFNPIVQVGEASALSDVKATFVDNNDGTYTVKFVPPIEGLYHITVKVGEDIYANKEFDIRNKRSCPPEGDIIGLNFECPGSNPPKCVMDKDIMTCLPDDERCDNNSTHPFRCKDGSCVESFKFCPCPGGKAYDHCGDWYQKQCYPVARYHECPFNMGESCTRKTGYTKQCEDGVCRSSKDLVPNQYVCPYGYVQCSDLTCHLTIEECQVYEECESVYDLKCDDQSCAHSNAECPFRVTCTNPSDFVCPDGTCVKNELYCKPVKCWDPTPIVCPSGACAKTRDACPKGISCGHTYALCEDNVCRHDCREE